MLLCTPWLCASVLPADERRDEWPIECEPPEPTLIESGALGARSGPVRLELCGTCACRWEGDATVWEWAWPWPCQLTERVSAS